MNKLRVILALVYLVSGYVLFLWGWSVIPADPAWIGIGAGTGLVISGLIIIIKLINNAIKQIEKSEERYGKNP